MPKEPRTLARSKCSQCRKDKQKCLPEKRVWPERCKRCERFDYACSANTSKNEQPTSRFRTISHDSDSVHTSTETPNSSHEDSNYNSTGHSQNPIDLCSEVVSTSSTTPDPIRHRSADHGNHQNDLEVLDELRKLPLQRDLLLGLLRSGAFKLVRWLLDKGVKLDYEIDDHDYSELLLEAIKRDDRGIVEHLLEEGVDLENSDVNEDTPLHVAAQHGSANVVKCLLDRETDHSALNANGETPLHIAAMEGRSGIVSILLDSGSDVHIKSKFTLQTPLHIAVDNEQFDTIVTLLQYGAFISAKDWEEETPIHLAARDSTADILGTLLKHVEQSSDLDLRNKFGDTALHLAVGSESCESSKKVAMLLEKGADLLVRYGFDRTVIHCAARSTPEVLDVLLRYVKQPCDLDLRDKYGDTALHLAIRAKSTVKVKMLLKKGADFTVPNCFIGDSALDMALSSDEVGIRELGRRCERSYRMGSSRLLPDIEISSMV